MSRKPLSVQAQQDRLRRKRREAGEVLTIFRKPLKESLTSVLPITAIVLVLCFTITPISNNAMMAFLLGSLLLIVGMGLFTLGSEMSMIPLGEAVGKEITRSKKVWVIVAISFLIGVIITVAEPDLELAAKLLTENKERIRFRDLETNADVAKVSVVGAGVIGNPGVAAQLFEALYDAGININMISTSEIKISVLVDRRDAEKAVQVIHDKFFAM